MTSDNSEVEDSYFQKRLARPILAIRGVKAKKRKLVCINSDKSDWNTEHAQRCRIARSSQEESEHQLRVMSQELNEQSQLNRSTLCSDGTFLSLCDNDTRN